MISHVERRSVVYIITWTLYLTSFSHTKHGKQSSTERFPLLMTPGDAPKKAGLTQSQDSPLDTFLKDRAIASFLWTKPQNSCILCVVISNGEISTDINLYIYICMYVCMYICIYICIYMGNFTIFCSSPEEYILRIFFLRFLTREHNC